MARKKQRTRSPHPGVKLKKRTRKSGQTSWRAHYIDPHTGKEVARTLSATALSTKEARTLWAKQLSRELERQRMEKARGVEPKREPVVLSSAVEQYLEAATERLRPNTISSYRQSLSRFLAWAKRAGVNSSDELGPPELAALRDTLIRAPKANALRGGRRGARSKERGKRARTSVNCDLRSIKAMLGDLRKRGLLPRLHRDDIADGLSVLPISREDPEFLNPATMAKLLQAAMRHDREVFEETREEHRGQGMKGGTHRYRPIAPFIAFLLLSGCRRGEALTLSWETVDLDALDQNGRQVGQFRLRASDTKTHRGRTIGLEVSPALRLLLVKLRLDSGGQGHVFGGDRPYTPHRVNAARKRLLGTYGAPTFNWQLLRSTCATYLANAPGIFGSASVFMSAKQLGHSVGVAERHYAGVHRGISRDAHSLEAAMQIEKELAQITGETSTLRRGVSM